MFFLKTASDSKFILKIRKCDHDLKEMAYFDILSTCKCTVRKVEDHFQLKNFFWGFIYRKLWTNPKNNLLCKLSRIQQVKVPTEEDEPFCIGTHFANSKFTFFGFCQFKNWNDRVWRFVEVLSFMLILLKLKLLKVQVIRISLNLVILVIFYMFFLMSG